MNPYKTLAMICWVLPILIAGPWGCSKGGGQVADDTESSSSDVDSDSGTGITNDTGSDSQGTDGDTGGTDSTLDTGTEGAWILPDHWKTSSDADADTDTDTDTDTDVDTDTDTDTDRFPMYGFATGTSGFTVAGTNMPVGTVVTHSSDCQGDADASGCLVVDAPFTETGQNFYLRLDLGDNAYVVDLFGATITARIKVITSGTGYAQCFFQNENPYTVGTQPSATSFTVAGDWTEVVFDVGGYTGVADPTLAARLGIQIGVGATATPASTTVLVDLLEVTLPQSDSDSESDTGTGSDTGNDTGFDTGTDTGTESDSDTGTGENK